MANTFEFIGKLSKPTGNLYEEKSFQYGKLKKCNLSITANDNKIFAEITGFEGDIIYTRISEDGEERNIEIPFDKRDEYIDKLVYYKQYTYYGEEKKIFATQGELAEYVANKFRNNEELYNKKYKLTGDIEYSKYNNKIYTKYKVNKIYEINEENVEEKSDAILELYITDTKEDSVLNNITLKGLTLHYDNKEKKTLPYNVDVIIPLEDKGKEFKDTIIEYITPKTNDKLYKIGLKAEVVAKNSKVEFNESMLSEDEIKNIRLGIQEKEDVIKNYTSGIGTFKRELIYKSLTRGYSTGCIQTDKTLDDLINPQGQYDNKIEDDIVDIEDLFE